jgi:hypothetical protein
MAHVRKTARPVDSFEPTDAVADEAVSFEFGPARATLEDLDEFAKCGWFSRDLARLLEGEVVLDRRDDEVVVYREFFIAGLRFPMHPLVVGVLKRFNLKFDQLNPLSFMKLCIFF